MIEGAWPGMRLAAAIDAIVANLRPYRFFFHRVRSEGGTAELSVGWFLDGMGGDEIRRDIMARAAELGLDLSLHLYPPDPPSWQKQIAAADVSAMLEQFVGRRCTGATIGLGRTLRVTFEPRAGESPPQLQSYASVWRISTDGRTTAGQHDCVDWQRGLEAALAALRGRELHGAEDLAPGDLRLEFAGMMVVEMSEASREDHGVEVRLPDGSYVDIGPGAIARVSNDAALTKGERAWADSAYRFWQRHARRLPPASASGRCGACAYLSALCGGFDFWDLGVCTNAASEHDGRLVGVASGCGAYCGRLPS
jgi:hypothetical protein